MKKVLLALLILFMFCGCENNKVVNNNTSKVTNNNVEINVNEYFDNNKTPISFYKINGNTLNKITSINTSLVPLEDIGVFSIYPSSSDTVNISNKYSQAFYDEWMKYNANNNLKIGFNIKFSLDDGRDVSFNVLDPASAIGEYNEYMLTYLYDDYKNRNSSFYSHIEQNEYNNETLFTSIKLQTGGYGNRINSKIVLSVFTYDSEDDFLENEYRGNSIYSINICVEGLEC